MWIPLSLQSFRTPIEPDRRLLLPVGPLLP